MLTKDVILVISEGMNQMIVSFIVREDYRLIC